MAARARPPPAALARPRAARRAAPPLPRRVAPRRAGGGDAPLAEEGDIVFYAAEPEEDGGAAPELRGPRLGVVVGGMCYYRFVAPARADAATGAVTADEDAQPMQCAPEAVLAVVKRTSGAPPSADALRAARARAEAALAERAQAPNS